MKIVFFGSPKFAVPFLNTLIIHEDISVVGVVTQPDKAVGRSSTPKPSAIAETADAYEIPVFKPENLKDKAVDKQLKPLEADAFIVLAYGNIIPNRILEIPPLGVINVHPSLLPKYRGATPMQAAIREGDKVTGISIMKMDKKMDHGPILAQLEIPLPDTVDYPELETIVAYKGPQLLVDSLLGYEKGRLKPTPQDDTKATYVKLFTRDTGRIDWNKHTADEVERMIRAYRPWPGVWTTWNGKRLKILGAQPRKSPLLKTKQHGQVFQKEHETRIAIKKSILAPTHLQLEGSKPTSIEDFIKGHPDFIGSTLE